MHQATFYIKLDNELVQCILCPHRCKIKIGNTGTCGVRKNVGGNLQLMSYGQTASIHFDPIEKKPLYHFFPGSTIFSVGSIGCNLKCQFCQNAEISQVTLSEFPYLYYYSPKDLVETALSKPENIGIAYTYNEPTIWYEYLLDTAILAQEKGLKNVLVTNGFINPDPLNEILTVVDAFNVDLKAFNNAFYQKYTFSQLEPVKQSLIQIKKSGKHLEITNLIIPTLNDQEEEFIKMLQWIENELGKDTVLHLSKYFPRYRTTIPSTSETILVKYHEIASKYLNYVYLGNVSTARGSHTFCSKCKKMIIQRNGYLTNTLGINESGKCKYCGNEIVKN